MDTVVHNNWSFSKTTNCYPSIENGSIFKLLRRHKYYILPWLCENVVLFSTLMHQNFEKVTHFSQKILFIKLVWRYIWGVPFLIIQTYTYTQFYNNIGCEILCQNLSYTLTTSLISDISHWKPWIVSGRNQMFFSQTIHLSCMHLRIQLNKGSVKCLIYWTLCKNPPSRIFYAVISNLSL